MDKIIWLIDDDWYAGYEKIHPDSVGPYIHAADLSKLVEEMEDEPFWAWRIRKLLDGRGE